jgi:hypothetical protein
MKPRMPPARTSVHVGADRKALYRAMTLSGVTTSVEMMIASRDLLEARQEVRRQGGIGADWGTPGVYVLVGEDRSGLGPETAIQKYDKALGRYPSEEPPSDDYDPTPSYNKGEHSCRWRHRVYTGLTRELLGRVDQHAAKPWWNRALLCRRAAPFPYDIAEIGYLEGRLHETLEAAFWLRREGRASWESNIKPDQKQILEKADLQSILLGVKLLGIPLDTEDDVKLMGILTPSGTP